LTPFARSSLLVLVAACGAAGAQVPSTATDVAILPPAPATTEPPDAAPPAVLRDAAAPVARGDAADDPSATADETPEHSSEEEHGLYLSDAGHPWPAGVSFGSADGGPSMNLSKGPLMRAGAVTVKGRLPPEVVQRIVRQNYGRFRLCYEGGLKRAPTLTGMVVVKFTIDASGAVASVMNAGSSLPDSTVVACVVRGFGNLSFPQPEAGAVVVTYPITFTPP
jgi:hypothetical protein